MPNELRIKRTKRRLEDLKVTQNIKIERSTYNFIRGTVNKLYGRPKIKKIARIKLVQVTMISLVSVSDSNEFRTFTMVCFNLLKTILYDSHARKKISLKITAFADSIRHVCLAWRYESVDIIHHAIKHLHPIRSLRSPIFNILMLS